ncbi:hypothetical protein CHS0354_000350 [Potamilus streckersoni]|uniref:Uncharacterized protein n=1 Tax=Potamilus streckersoni TaxID=2493646 RepID=A0AAE0W726_9BIVA|nr:hypothetical protein CHS0354_000350 [Potamilus streckersoni]
MACINNFESYTMFTGLGFDWLDQIIFWSEEDTGTISSVSRLVTRRWPILSGLDSPRNLLVLPLEGRIFWVSETIYVRKIESSKLDGSDKKDVVQISFSSNPASISFDPSTNSILSNSMSAIKSFEIEELTLKEKYPSQIQSIRRITDLKVYDDRLQPSKKGPCEVLNGGCEHTCIANGLVNRTCRCNLGFHQDTINGNNCSSAPVSNNFLLVSDWTHDMIYQLSLDTNDVQAIDINTIRDPTGVAYDHTRKTVVWGSSADQKIFSVGINGTDEMILFQTGNIYKTYPDRLAIDFSTRNIYYTAVGVNEVLVPQGGYIAVISVKKLHKLLIKGLRRPRDIVLYPSKGLMFWTDLGSNPHVGRAQMDGQESIQVINTSVTYPNGLALDFSANRLYWSDGYTDIIESCNLNGSDRRVIFRDSGAFLMDIAFDNARNLYYTAWNRPYITKVMLSQQFQVVYLLEKPELGRLDALDIYTVDGQPRNPFCSYNNGNCSTFCLPNIYGRTCSCEDEVPILEDGKTCSNIPTTTSTPIIPIKTTTTSSTFSHSQTSTPQSTDTTNRNLNETVTGENNPTLIYIGAGSSAGILLLLFAVVLIVWCIRKRTIARHKQEQFEQIRALGETAVPSRTWEENTISSVSEIYDTVQDSQNNSDPTYLAAGIDNRALNNQSAWNNHRNDLYRTDPDYLTVQTHNNTFRGESTEIRLYHGRVGQDHSIPDYETLIKAKETSYPQTKV